MKSYCAGHVTELITNPEIARSEVTASLRHVAAARYGALNSKQIEAGETWRMKPFERPVHVVWDSIGQLFNRDVIGPSMSNYFGATDVPLVNLPALARGVFMPLRRPFRSAEQLENWFESSSRTLINAAAVAGHQVTDEPSARTWAGLMAGPMQTKTAWSVALKVQAEARERHRGDPDKQLIFAEEFASEFGDSLTSNVGFRLESGRLVLDYQNSCFKTDRGKSMCGACPRDDLTLAGIESLRSTG